MAANIHELNEKIEIMEQTVHLLNNARTTGKISSYQIKTTKVKTKKKITILCKSLV